MNATLPSTGAAADDSPLRKTRIGRILVLTVANPPVNALSYPVRIGLTEAIEQGCQDPDIDAMILRCEGKSFISGADIKEFSNPRDPRVSELVEFVERSTKPIVAALHGTVLGGGLEISMACHYRIARPDVVLGLPEVNLGLLPGAGGTQRLPRLIGIPRSLDIIVGGHTMSAHEAVDCGLVDRLSEGDLQANALAFAVDRVEQERKPRRTSDRRVAEADPAIIERFRSSVRQRHPGFLAPLHCIAAIEASVLPFEQGLQKEKSLFLELFGSDQAKAMQYAFFAQREVARLPAGAAAASRGHGILLLGEGPQADHFAHVLGSGNERLTRLAGADACKEPLSGEDAAQLAGAAWVIDACALDPSRQGAMLGALARAGAANLSSLAPLEELPALAGPLGPQVTLSGVRTSPIPGSRLVETYPGPSGAAALEPVHRALQSAGASPMVLEGQSEPLQARLLAAVHSVLEDIARAGTSQTMIAAALHAHGIRPSAFGFEDPADTSDVTEDQRAIIDVLMGAVCDQALQLTVTAGLRPVQIDVACILGLGFPAYRTAPCRMLETRSRSSLAAAAQASARRLGISLRLPSLSAEGSS